MDAVNRYSKLDYPVKPTLFFEFHGTEHVAFQEQAEMVGALAQKILAVAVDSSGRPGRKNATISGRHVTMPTTRRWRCVREPGVGRPMCACRFRSSPSAFWKRASDIQESGLIAPLVGHVGDGNFHLVFLDGSGQARGDPKLAAEVNDRMVARAIESRWHLHGRTRCRLRQDRIPEARAR